MNNSIDLIRRAGAHIVMPGMASAHSHAFQRALRGRTQRRSTHSKTFWSWRDQMFQLVERLTPEAVFDLSRFAFVELAMSGVTAVGEFHYVHHDVGGRPYANRLELSQAVIRAAQETGIRLTLIHTAYFRAGYQQTVHAGQKRFCDDDVDAVLRDVEALQTWVKRHAPNIRVALAAHSLRACSRQQVRELAVYARERGLPFHMHVAEQRREIDECVAEYGLRPMTLLAEDGILDERFVAIHATHLDEREIAALGAARAFACVCRSTERDLGDGHPQAGEMARAGVRFCVGADSHAAPDAFDEVRAIELDERTRVEQRMVAMDADALLQTATANGYAAIGFSAAIGQDKVYLRVNDAALAGASDDLLTDAVMFGATARAVDEVSVGGDIIVQGGQHRCYAQAREAYERCLGRPG